MHAISDRIERNKLLERREEIKLTLELLRAEKLGLQGNERSMDPEAFRRRMHLFDCLTCWYEDETAQIDNALTGPASSICGRPERSRNVPY
jgi:hypothetical protein